MCVDDIKAGSAMLIISFALTIPFEVLMFGNIVDNVRWCSPASLWYVDHGDRMWCEMESAEQKTTLDTKPEHAEATGVYNNSAADHDNTEQNALKIDADVDATGTGQKRSFGKPPV